MKDILKMAWLSKLFGSRSEVSKRPTSACYLWAPNDLLDLWQCMHKNNVTHQSRPCLPKEDWARVDSLFESAKPDMVMLLTEVSAERVGEEVYVFFEPLVHVVIALCHIEKEASITADEELWDDESPEYLGAGFMELTSEAEQLLSRSTD